MKNALNVMLNREKSNSANERAVADLVRVKSMTRLNLKSKALAAAFSVPALMVSACLVLQPAPVQAQEKTVAARVKDEKTAERIDMVSGIRAMGQRIGASLCLANAGVDATANTKVAADSMAELAVIIDTMENGSADLGRGKEEDRRVMGSINGLKSNWALFSARIEPLIAGQDVEANYDFLKRQNLNMSYASRDLLVRLMQVYVQPPEILQSYAFTLDIAARQRAITQQMAKEICGLATKDPVMGNVLRLKNATRLFDLSLTALSDGFDAAGVIKPPSPEIAEKISTIKGEWDALEPAIQGATAMGAIDAAAAGEIFVKLDSIYAHLKDLGALYITASKFQG
jgi:hypothetical protein